MNGVPKSNKSIPVKALQRYRDECKEQDLGLECAIATLAIQAVHLHHAMLDDSYQRTMGAAGTIRQEAANVIKALEQEYPDMGWNTYPWKKKSRG